MKNRLTVASMTNVGNRRVNEDSIGVFAHDDAVGCVLCDGLGGHGMGDVASQLFVDVFRREYEKSEKVTDILVHTFETAQENLLAEQIKRHAPNRIKTTAVIAIADGRKLHMAHIGDSRAYIFNKDKVVTRTMDHSIPQMLVLSKQITDADIRNHPDRSMLLRVMGTEWHDNKKYDVMKPVPLRKVQAVLLCSDGFWELIDEECMCQTLKDAATVQDWLDTMVNIVNVNGSDRDMDNFSAIAVWNERK